MSASAPGTDAQQVETRDLDAARSFIAGTVGPFRLMPLARPPITARAARCSVGRIGLVEVTYSGLVRIDAVCAPDEYIIETWLEGCGLVGRPGTRHHEVRPGSVVLRAAGAELRTDMAADCRMLVLRGSRDLIDAILFPRLRGGGEVLRRLAGDGAMRVLDRPLDPAARRVFDWILAERRSGSPVLSSPALAPDLERLIVRALCGDRGDEEPSALRGPRPYYLRRAQQFAEGMPHGRISLDVLAAAAGVSKRTLQSGFVRWAGITPTQWLTRQRLARVRAELTAPGSRDGVTEIAYRHGFNHLGRFAALYREVYGERPSDTLRRS